MHSRGLAVLLELLHHLGKIHGDGVADSVARKRASRRLGCHSMSARLVFSKRGEHARPGLRVERPRMARASRASGFVPPANAC